MNDHKKLIVDGNAFYELDIDCINRKKKHKDGYRTDKNQKNDVSPRKPISRGRIED